MQLLSVLALAAITGTAMATPVEVAAPLPSCINGMFYGEAACKQNCKGGKCSIEDGHQNDKDYICICNDTSKPGCADMFKGKAACQAKCKSGTCTQLLLPYECKCPKS
ncbi:hypothetical protein VFPPC_11200 [Pochonia chlamydosporia 170]|uniref:Uncharacterized protein n=1 Tax=Pochonia chlamydosporia 170 TaxID=1380566 RepID=A0A179FBF0_METCM|nr:hypothetical protein VFPPC_11200 [Pochonia chlamydosporia 170]OAQ62747.1 hypothetical protein VFPPC_11200 [Pochonia chlamydosporia 170]